MFRARFGPSERDRVSVSARARARARVQFRVSTRS